MGPQDQQVKMAPMVLMLHHLQTACQATMVPAAVHQTVAVATVVMLLQVAMVVLETIQEA
jgi:hypothetical protein